MDQDNNRFSTRVIIFLILLFSPLFGQLSAVELESDNSSTVSELSVQNSNNTELATVNQDQDDQVQHEEEHGETEGHGSEEASSHKPPGWSVLPFVILLLMIATGPLFYEHFWHKNYPKIAILLAAIVVLYYLFALNNEHGPVHAFFEYFQFIALLASLYIASGGIHIDIDKKSSPMANSILLICGAVIANLIGTTGASMLLIKPFMRLNKHRIKPYHIVFFIFIVSNVGGSLTPIGDPPLFLGFLKGVPFEWTITHNFLPWVFGISLLTLIFYFFDKRNKDVIDEDEIQTEFTNKIKVSGAKNFGWLALVIISVFIDPNVFDWVPAINYHGQRFSFIREFIMFGVCFFSYRFADKEAIQSNDFSFEPIREVAFIFIGIFGTMMPALELVSEFAKSPEGVALISQNTLYWGTGALSGFLDNAPTYLNFLAASMASQGADINSISEVVEYATGDTYPHSQLYLKAISIAAVFFGAMTYIGNGPNFMVKSIAEQVGIKMPSFFGYMIRFSIPFLLPMIILTWLIFFLFAK
ncbi:sodium:proton antiporter [Mangrovivirga cuniculi]|uniref:Citrate transporter n=1 Tax=Mangrovivirga cuniculi TaxID=2715131 RepID=A0A4D7JRG7_9BACT|nr:sodium:proton antiporter [Mangrovivirga cuniculi]QCK13525.1 citrate transporter [Mangrovivirga cuniculi]